MRNSTKWLLISGIILGLILSLYSTYLDFLIHYGIISSNLFCSINEFIDCKSIYLSKYSRIFGFSKSFLGVLYFIILATNFTLLLKKTDESRFNIFLFFLSIGALFSVYNLIQIIFVIGKICPLCLLLQAINILLFISIVVERRVHYKDVYSIKFTNYFYSQLVMIIVIMFFGFHLQKKINEYLSIDNSNTKADNYIENYFSSNKIEFNFTNQVQILGNKNSKIEIVIFSDFQCAYCSNASSILKELQSKYENDVKIIFIHYPLDKTVNPHTPNSNHIYAGLASKAIICLSKTESFWEVHDYFFENQDNFSEAFFNDYIDKYNLKDCINEKETIEFLNYNMDLGNMAGLEGTPSIFINGRPMKRWYDKELMSKIVHFEKLFQKHN
ncbi:MAG: thioredoxin domain-containing protein [Draconibacterium sp.]|nr:thioredoxin domain-containing protein [Draconibacterium sp.]